MVKHISAKSYSTRGNKSTSSHQNYIIQDSSSSDLSLINTIVYKDKVNFTREQYHEQQSISKLQIAQNSMIQSQQYQVAENKKNVLKNSNHCNLEDILSTKGTTPKTVNSVFKIDNWALNPSIASINNVKLHASRAAAAKYLGEMAVEDLFKDSSETDEKKILGSEYRSSNNSMSTNVNGGDCDISNNINSFNYGNYSGYQMKRKKKNDTVSEWLVNNENGKTYKVFTEISKLNSEIVHDFSRSVVETNQMLKDIYNIKAVAELGSNKHATATSSSINSVNNNNNYNNNRYKSNDKYNTINFSEKSNSRSHVKNAKMVTGLYHDFDTQSPYAIPNSPLALLDLSSVEDSRYNVNPRFQCSRNGVARVSELLTLKMLQEEFNLREPHKKVENYTKDELLTILGHGSICITQSSAYFAYKDVLNLFDLERKSVLTLLSENTSNSHVDNNNPISITKEALVNNVQSQRDIAWRLQQEQMEKNRLYAEQELIEESLHVYPCALHHHPVALTCELTCRGQSRVSVKTCSTSSNSHCSGVLLWSCTRCDWDICQSCYDIDVLPPYERQNKLIQLQVEKRKEYEELKNKSILQQVKLRQECEENQVLLFKKFQSHYPELIFHSHIKNPLPNHINTKKRFVYSIVSCDSFLNIKYSKYEFDSSYQDLNEANARATYLFYICNPWGFNYDEMLNETIEKLEQPGGLLYYSITPEGLSTWRVIVMNSSTI